MKISAIKSDLLLLLTAAIWGFAFIAQKKGMEFVGPFLFNGIRFALGSLILIPFIFTKGNRKKSNLQNNHKTSLLAGILAGLVLFIAASFQQIGVNYTNAGNAGFITGLYVILVPIFGIFLQHKLPKGIWFGAILAAIGLYFLSVTNNFNIRLGDFLVFISAIFWAIHVHIIGIFSGRSFSLILASIQFALCSILSLIAAVLFEDIQISAIINALVPILYGGIISVGIAYTLQIIAQKKALPSHSAIIMSLEGLFAVFGGWLILGELISLRGLFGCALMLIGMISAQMSRISKPGGRRAINN